MTEAVLQLHSGDPREMCNITEKWEDPTYEKDPAYRQLIIEDMLQGKDGLLLARSVVHAQCHINSLLVAGSFQHPTRSDRTTYKTLLTAAGIIVGTEAQWDTAATPKSTSATSSSATGTPGSPSADGGDGTDQAITSDINPFLHSHTKQYRIAPTAYYELERKLATWLGTGIANLQRRKARLTKCNHVGTLFLHTFLLEGRKNLPDNFVQKIVKKLAAHRAVGIVAKTFECFEEYMGREQDMQRELLIAGDRTTITDKILACELPKAVRIGLGDSAYSMLLSEMNNPVHVAADGGHAMGNLERTDAAMQRWLSSELEFDEAAAAHNGSSRSAPGTLREDPSRHRQKEKEKVKTRGEPKLSELDPPVQWDGDYDSRVGPCQLVDKTIANNKKPCGKAHFHRVCPIMIARKKEQAKKDAAASGSGRKVDGDEADYSTTRPAVMEPDDDELLASALVDSGLTGGGGSYITAQELDELDQEGFDDARTGSSRCVSGAPVISEAEAHDPVVAGLPLHELEQVSEHTSRFDAFPHVPRNLLPLTLLPQRGGERLYMAPVGDLEGIFYLNFEREEFGKYVHSTSHPLAAPPGHDRCTHAGSMLEAVRRLASSVPPTFRGPMYYGGLRIGEIVTQERAALADADHQEQNRFADATIAEELSAIAAREQREAALAASTAERVAREALESDAVALAASVAEREAQEAHGKQLQALAQAKQRWELTAALREAELQSQLDAALAALVESPPPADAPAAAPVLSATDAEWVAKMVAKAKAAEAAEIATAQAAALADAESAAAAAAGPCVIDLSLSTPPPAPSEGSGP